MPQAFCLMSLFDYFLFHASLLAHSVAASVTQRVARVLQGEDQIASWPRVEQHMALGPNLIWAQGPISFGPRAESHFGPGPNLIWAQGQISFGSRAKSH